MPINSTTGAAIAGMLGRPYLYVSPSTTSYQDIGGGDPDSYILLDPTSSHDWDTHNVTLPAGAILNGNGATITSGAGPIDSTGPIIIPSDGCRVQNLRVVATSTVIFQALIGFIADPATNVVVENFWGEGHTDGVYMALGTTPATPVLWTIRSSNIYTKGDALFANGQSSSGILTLQDNNFHAIGPSPILVAQGSAYDTARACFASGFGINVVGGGSYVAGGAGTFNACFEADNVNGTATINVYGNPLLYAYGTSASIGRESNSGDFPNGLGNGVVKISEGATINPATTLERLAFVAASLGYSDRGVSYAGRSR